MGMSQRLTAPCGTLRQSVVLCEYNLEPATLQELGRKKFDVSAGHQGYSGRDEATGTNVGCRWGECDR
jgi:hypothetical protein